MARQRLSHPEMKIPLFVHMVLEKLANNPLTFSEQVRAFTVKLKVLLAADNITHDHGAV